MHIKYICCCMIILGICAPCRATYSADVKQEKIVFDAVTLSDALSLTLVANPVLAAFSWEVRASEARTLQAGLYPNPELDVEMENFGGKRELNSVDSAETIFQISQLIELGNKRHKRQQLKSLETKLAQWDYETKRNDIFAEVKRAFIDILIAQKRLSFLKELSVLDEQVLNTVAERVKAGKVSPIENTKAEMILFSNRIKQEKARNLLETARQKLASYWGENQVGFTRAAGDIDTILSVPPREQLKLRLADNPDNARWETEIAKNQANIILEKSERIPDVTAYTGFRWFNEANDNYGFVAGISIPLPLFDRNQGSVQEAQFLMEKAKQERLHTRVKLTSQFGAAYNLLNTAYSEVMSLKEHILPRADDTFNASNEAFKEGKLSYLQLLDAQRILFDSEMQYLEAVAAYHHAVIDMEQLVTQPLFDKD